MSHRILIRNADVVLPSGVERTDVLVVGTRIASVGAPAGTQADEVIDATGLVLMPGVVDDQVHFRDPGLTHKEDLYTATRACAKGGVTSFLEMPNTNPTTTSQAALEAKLALGKHKSIVNYGFYVGATPQNVTELKFAHRTPGIKIFIGSSTGDLLVDEQDALERIFAETTLPICAHCEDETTVRANKARLGDNLTIHDHSRIRNVEAAVIATNRAIDLSWRHKHNFHVLHVSTGAEADILKTTHEYITSEICLHHVFFTVDDYDRLGSRIQMNPSIKHRADVERLWQALQEGTIQVIATDHAPHTLEEKAQPYPKSPSGLPAVENSLALMLNEVNRGRVTLSQVAGWMCDAPARVWNLLGKGRIAEGFDADLVLVDMNLKQTIRDAEQETKTKWSPWDGTELQGWAVRTFVMGREVFHYGKVLDQHRGTEIEFDLKLGGYRGTANGGTARS
ncbi:MAG: dihydroorotase [Myxococcales bacterium]|nr:dihydroorotase [Myxococcales bacterium]